MAWFSLPTQPGSRLVAEKVLRSGQGVQLIVFFAAIREILKKEIYRGDKHCFCSLKTKARSRY